jgi:hypothetical protein
MQSIRGRDDCAIASKCVAKQINQDLLDLHDADMQRQRQREQFTGTDFRRSPPHFLAGLPWTRPPWPDRRR